MKTREKFEQWILDEDHPCIMAQTVFSQEHVKTKQYGQLGDPLQTDALLKDLKNYIAEYDFETNDFKSFIAVFPESNIATEDEFERLLWKQLEEIEKIDTKDWDPSVSRDPEDDNFSFSIAGRSFYIVGMHPNSSRQARRSPYPSIAFNLHVQFEKLRDMGAYEKVRDKIRARDKELQGSMNPMLEDFGSSSEAKQYRGKATEDDWVCPFHQ